MARVLFMLLLLITAKHSYSQMTLTREEYDELSEKSKKTEALEKEKVGWEEEKKKLEAEIVLLKKGLSSNTLDSSDSKKELEILKAKNNVLEGKYEALKKEKGSLKKLQEENKELRGKILEMEVANERTESTLMEKMTEIEKLKSGSYSSTNEVAKLQSEKKELESKIGGLEKDKNALTNEIVKARAEAKEAEEALEPTKLENERLVVENRKLKSRSTPSGGTEAHTLILDTEYKLNISKIGGAALGLEELKNKLDGYRQLCNVMVDSEIVLSKPYDKTAVSKMVAKLSSTKGYTPQQQNDIAQRKDLLESYCENTNLFYEKVKLANTFGSEHELAKKVLQKAMVETPIKDYPYLVQQSEKKIKDLSYLSSTPVKINCD